MKSTESDNQSLDNLGCTVHVTQLPVVLSSNATSYPISLFQQAFKCLWGDAINLGIAKIKIDPIRKV